MNRELETYFFLELSQQMNYFYIIGNKLEVNATVQALSYCRFKFVLQLEENSKWTEQLS